MLERAGIERADLVIAVTGDDEDNILISQVAREKYGVERVVARCNNPRNLAALRAAGRQAGHLGHRPDPAPDRARGAQVRPGAPARPARGAARDHRARGGRGLRGGGQAGQGPRPARGLARDLDPARRRRLRAHRRLGGPGRATRCCWCSTWASRTASPSASPAAWRPRPDGGRPRGRLPAGRRRPGRRRAARAGCARRAPTARILLVGREPDPPYNRPAAVQGVPPRGGEPRGRALPPGRVVGGAGRSSCSPARA